VVEHKSLKLTIGLIGMHGVSFNCENSKQIKNDNRLNEAYRLMKKSKFLFSQCEGVPAGIMVRKVNKNMKIMKQVIDELDSSASKDFKN